MTSTNKERIKQAAKAGRRSGKVRAANNKERNAGIYVSFRYLSGLYQPQINNIKALKFLDEIGVCPNLRINAERGIKPEVLLAAGCKLTPKQVKNIVKKEADKIS